MSNFTLVSLCTQDPRTFPIRQVLYAALDLIISYRNEPLRKVYLNFIFRLLLNKCLHRSYTHHVIWISTVYTGLRVVFTLS